MWAWACGVGGKSRQGARISGGQKGYFVRAIGGSRQR